MAIERVREYFRGLGIESRIIEFEASSETVELAAVAVGCEPKRIANTMAFLVGERPILVVMAGDARIANPTFKAEFATKPKMIAPAELPELIGHEMGGVCPFGINEKVAVYLDESLRRFETVFPAAGSGNSAIELSLAELEKYSHSVRWVDIGKDWE